jgi:VanZ family protein
LHFEFLNSRTVRLWAPVVAYMGAIFFVSSLHSAPLPSGVSDKSAHALAYAGLACLVGRALGGGLPPSITGLKLVIGFAISVLYAGSDEVHQRFVPGRSADIADVAADAIGAAVALIAVWAWGILSARSRQ